MKMEKVRDCEMELLVVIHIKVTFIISLAQLAKITSEDEKNKYIVPDKI